MKSPESYAAAVHIVTTSVGTHDPQTYVDYEATEANIATAIRQAQVDALCVAAQIVRQLLVKYPLIRTAEAVVEEIADKIEGLAAKI